MIIKVGEASATIHFKGGSVIDYVQMPARYATSNALEQAIIENSVQFKTGRITLIPGMTIEVPDDAAARARKMRNKKVVPVAVDGSDVQGVPQTEDGETVQHVTVVDKADAVEWLKEHYPDKGYTATKLRTAEAFNAACEECGVVFEFKS